MKKTKKRHNRFTLFEGEKVITSTRLHWINLVWPVVMTLAASAALIWRCIYRNISLINMLSGYTVITQQYQHLACNAGAVLLLLLVLRYLIRIAKALLTEYFITDRRVIITSGLITVTLSEMLLERCETVTLSQNLLERILGSGDIMIISAGSSLLLNDVPDVNTFRMKIIEASSRHLKNTSS